MDTNRIRKYIGIISLFVISCNNTTPEIKNEQVPIKESTPITGSLQYTEIPDSAASSQIMPSEVKTFVKAISEGASLDTFMNEKWDFLYHEDNRCDGSTDGELPNLTASQIDQIIKLNVKNDGDGWACDKKAPSTFEMDFLLKSKVKTWDRFEIAQYSEIKEKIFYILGSGESDYLKVYYNHKFKIYKLEYISEDPG